MPQGGQLFTTGFKHLDRKLRQMPLRLQGRILRTELKKAAEPIRDTAKALFPKKSGRTAKRIRIRTTKPRRDGSRDVRIGVFGPATGGKSRDFATARAAEFGTAHTAGTAPLRMALGLRKASALAGLKDGLARGVLRAAREA